MMNPAEPSPLSSKEVFYRQQTTIPPQPCQEQPCHREPDHAQHVAIATWPCKIVPSSVHTLPAVLVFSFFVVVFFLLHYPVAHSVFSLCCLSAYFLLTSCTLPAKPSLASSSLWLTASAFSSQAADLSLCPSLNNTLPSTPVPMSCVWVPSSLCS